MLTMDNQLRGTVETDIGQTRNVSGLATQENDTEK